MEPRGFLSDIELTQQTFEGLLRTAEPLGELLRLDP
jgi:hypothetical protein